MISSIVSLLPVNVASVSARLVEACLVILIAFIAAKAIWFIFYGAEALPSQLKLHTDRPVQNLELKTDYSALLAVNLFRTKGDRVAVGQNISVPETQLRLTLRGVRTGSDPQAGSAVIEAPGLGQRTLATGSDITDGVKLDEIYSDRVIINRRGARESLFLREQTQRRVLGVLDTVEPDSASASDLNLAGESNIELAAEDWTDGLRLRPHIAQGEMIGFQVRDNTHLEVLQASGLLPGDVITQLNGIELNNADSTRIALEDITKAERAEFIILREGEPMTLIIPLGAG